MIRLDHLLVKRYPHYSRRQLVTWIEEGRVTVNGRVAAKASLLVDAAAHITLSDQPVYVSRAGFKLERALDHFALDVHGLVALDAGLSTGGFTHCLLKRGIKKVFGVDVGSGQVHPDIRADERVIVMENMNLKELPDVGELVDLVTLDLSFISVLKVMNTVLRVLKPGGHLVVLIKPQFEVGKEAADRGRGIVRDSVLHEQVIATVVAGIQELGFTSVGVIESPLLGGDGNKEFLAYFIARKG